MEMHIDTDEANACQIRTRGCGTHDQVAGHAQTVTDAARCRRTEEAMIVGKVIGSIVPPERAKSWWEINS